LQVYQIFASGSSAVVMYLTTEPEIKGSNPTG
jgi:hypothetical protein